MEGIDLDPSFTLESTVKAFIRLLETVEVSDSGREFRPNYISSCRAQDASRLIQLVEEMKSHIKDL